MANKFRFDAVAGLLPLRTRADLTVHSDDLLARLAKPAQAPAQQK